MKEECKHEWKVISTWGVYTYFIRRQCQKCEKCEDAKINEGDWEDSPIYSISSPKLPNLIK